MNILKAVAAAGLAGGLAVSGAAGAQTVIDLTHPIPTFRPMADDPMKPDLSQPWGESRLFPTFGQHAVLSIVQFPVNLGYFDLGTLVISEHHGTHLDTPAHFLNNESSMEPGGTPPEERRLVHQLEGADLVGKIVLIDISARVQAELDKNGGRPSPDHAVTSFTEANGVAITADDISAVEDQLQDGVWLVLNTGWSQFYFDGPDFMKDPYVNAFNYPGLSLGGIDRLIGIMDRKGVRIRGIVADNIGVEGGESAAGEDDKGTNAWAGHARLLQRNIMLVENATNLGLLAQVDGDCMLTVGAPKHVRGTGGPSRLLAICN